HSSANGFESPTGRCERPRVRARSGHGARAFGHAARTRRWHCAPMLAAIHSAAVLGVDAVPVLVEVDVATGLPNWTLVGLAAGAVKESRERVSAALANSGFYVPPRRITVN